VFTQQVGLCWLKKTILTFPFILLATLGYRNAKASVETPATYAFEKSAYDNYLKA